MKSPNPPALPGHNRNPLTTPNLNCLQVWLNVGQNAVLKNQESVTISYDGTILRQHYLGQIRKYTNIELSQYHVAVIMAQPHFCDDSWYIPLVHNQWSVLLIQLRNIAAVINQHNYLSHFHWIDLLFQIRLEYDEKRQSVSICTIIDK